MRLGKKFTTFGVIIGAVFASLLLSPLNVLASNAPKPVNLYMFWGDGCPHCKHADETFQPYVEKHSNVKYHKFEIYKSKDNQQKMRAVGDKLDIEASGVPLIVVGDKVYLGFSPATSKEVEKRLEYCSKKSCPDSVAEIVGVEQVNASNGDQSEETGATTEPIETIELPLIGEIDVGKFSLPVLTVIIGLLDGFNPCAMWALLFIITLLIGFKDRKRMWLYGTTFIVTSAVVYFMFMVAWLNLFMFIGQVTWIRLIIGLLAIGVGIYYLYDWSKKSTVCKVSGGERSQKVFAKLRQIIKEKNILIGLIGVILLAAAVNIVELACSAGLPVLYTGILSASGLAVWQYYLYMLLYIIFFMLDDLIVFIVAMVSLKAIGLDSKYTRAIRLVGGIIMLILGLLLIFAPQVLMFG